MAWNFPGAGGGGSAAVTSFVTVGSGSEDYASIAAAIAASKYNIRLTSSITEAASTAMPNQPIRIVFDGPSITLTMAANTQWTSASYSVVFQVHLNGGTIKRDSDSSANLYLFDFTEVLGRVDFYGGGTYRTLGSTSTSNALCNPLVGSRMFGSYDIRASNSGSVGAGINCAAEFYAESLNIIGGGSSSKNGLVLTGSVAQRINKLVSSGTWNTASSSMAINITTGSECSIGTLEVTSLAGTEYRLGCVVENYQDDTALTRTVVTADTRILSGSITANQNWTFPSSLDGVVIKDVALIGFEIEPHRISYKEKATTGNTKTELFIDASALRLAVASDQSYLCNLRLISQRDQQDIAVFQFLGATIHNDGGTTTILNGTASSSPDASVGTGSTLTLHIEADNTNDALAVFVTANAGQNWSHKLTVDLVEITN